MFGLKPDQVRVLSPFVGGGFGGKGLWSHQILAAAASKLAGRPVRLALSREGVFRLIGGRTRPSSASRSARTRDGRLDALIHTGVAAMTTHNNCPEQFTFPARHLYAAKSFRLEQKVADLDMLANTFMRAPGESIGTFALECAIDELAHEHRHRPDRAAAAQRARDGPDDRHRLFVAPPASKAYADGAARFGWDERNATPARTARRRMADRHGRAPPRTYPYYRMPGGAARDLRSTPTAAPPCRPRRHEMGMGTATVQAQHAADRLGLPLEQVSFEYGDSRPAGRHHGRRLVADRGIDRARSRRRPTRWSSEC